MHMDSFENFILYNIKLPMQSTFIKNNFCLFMIDFTKEKNEKTLFDDFWEIIAEVYGN